MPKLSVIIPSVGDPYLERTLQDIKEKFETDYEVIVVNGKKIGMREAINKGVAQSKGEYIMKTDEHCMFQQGVDKKLLARIKDNWVVTPRRWRLDVEKWEIIETMPADYERLIISTPDKIGGVHWDSRTRKRRHIRLDETMVMQGSCYLMSRKHWDWLGGLQTEGYGSFAQEAIEICLKTWLGGGKVMVNKQTWYAHRDRRFGRFAKLDRKQIKEGNAYSRDFWLNNRWKDRIHDIEWLMERFNLTC